MADDLFWTAWLAAIFAIAAVAAIRDRKLGLAIGAAAAILALAAGWSALHWGGYIQRITPDYCRDLQDLAEGSANGAQYLKLKAARGCE